MAEAEVEAARGTESFVRATRRTPRLALTSSFGVVLGARGTVFDLPDTPRDLDDLGGFWRVRLEFQQRLFTFGRSGWRTRSLRWRPIRISYPP